MFISTISTFYLSAQVDDLPIPTHQPALLCHMTTTKWGEWQLKWASSTAHKASKLLLSLHHRAAWHSARIALSAPFCMHELTDTIGSCRYDWQGNKKTCHPSHTECMANPALLVLSHGCLRHRWTPEFLATRLILFNMIASRINIKPNAKWLV